MYLRPVFCEGGKKKIKKGETQHPFRNTEKQEKKLPRDCSSFGVFLTRYTFISLPTLSSIYTFWMQDKEVSRDPGLPWVSAMLSYFPRPSSFYTRHCPGPWCRLCVAPWASAFLQSLAWNANRLGLLALSGFLCLAPTFFSVLYSWMCWALYLLVYFFHMIRFLFFVYSNLLDWYLSFAVEAFRIMVHYFVAYIVFQAVLENINNFSYTSHNFNCFLFFFFLRLAHFLW